jgi:diketogulonate reductase-like aldo/keto reductase
MHIGARPACADDIRRLSGGILSWAARRSEELIKRVIAGQRDRAFVVSKVEASDVARGAMARACEASLSRLGTDYLDLYL